MRTFLGLTAAAFTAYLTWALGQIVLRLAKGFWMFVPIAWLYAAVFISLTVASVGLPVMVALKHFTRKPWAYAVVGAVCGLPILLIMSGGYAVIFYDQCLDHVGEGCPSQLAFFGGGLLNCLLDPTLGLYAAVTGMTGGLAFWAVTRIRSA